METAIGLTIACAGGIMLMTFVPVMWAIPAAAAWGFIVGKIVKTVEER